MINEDKFRTLFANNLIKYRKINNLTQADLAQKLNYSDKAISKWERGESIPDLYTLLCIAQFYGVSINDLCSDKDATKMKKANSNKLFVTILSYILVWFIATLCFVILNMIFPNSGNKFWLSYIVAIPVSSIVLTVFSILWYNTLCQGISVSMLVWSLAVTFHLIFNITNSILIYIIAIPFQVLVIIWFIMRATNKKRK